MILAPATFARVGILVLLTVVLQVSGAAQIDVLGASPNLVPLVVVGIAFFGGSIAGAGSGFAAGLLLDLSLGHLAGTSSLVLTAVGYGAGRYREASDPAHGLAPIAFALAGTAGYLVANAAVTFMLGVEAQVSLLVVRELEAQVSLLVVRELVVTVLLNGLLALPVFWLLGKALRSALVSDPRVRRRRQRTRETGPIGLRGLEV